MEVQNESEILKELPVVKSQGVKQYDLEERTFTYAQRVRQFVKTLPKNLANTEDSKQLVRASGSVGANYIEAKESRYWLKLLDIDNDVVLEKKQFELIQEATELMNIFGSIVRKSE